MHTLISQVQYEVVEEIIYGLESGILFGQHCVLIFFCEFYAYVFPVGLLTRERCFVSMMGFVFMEQRFSKLLLPICIGMSISCSASGFFYQISFSHIKLLIIVGVILLITSH